MIDQKIIGEPFQITVRMRPGDGQGKNAYLNRQPYFQKMERFLIHETGIHFIDLFRHFFGEIERPSLVKVTSLDLEGNLQSYDFDGLWATCAQHEIDHLNGKLFIDYLGPMRRSLITSKMRKIKKEKIRKNEIEK